MVDGSTVTNLDFGSLFQSSHEQKKITVTNDGNALNNLYVTAVDAVNASTAKKTILGGNEFREGVAHSMVYASTDGRSWYEISGENKLKIADSLASGSSVSFYLKVTVPAGAALNQQQFALKFSAEN